VCPSNWFGAKVGYLQRLQVTQPPEPSPLVEYSLGIMDAEQDSWVTCSTTKSIIC